MKSPKWPNSKEKVCRENLGLERITILLEKLGNPQKNIPPVFHIAGTNGKGSVSSFLKYIFEADGYIVHRYTSPHIINFNERIEVCGKPITDEYYDELAKEVRQVVEKNNLEITYFEAITAIAFLAFSRNKANATIIEVGLGGRLDSTNVIDNPLVTIITQISLDHTEILGNTVEKIAMEKLGILKEGSPVIVSKQEESVLKVINEEALKLGCQIYEYNKHWSYKKQGDSYLFEGIYKLIQTEKPSLEGPHQIINAGTAIAAILCQNKVKVSDKAIKEGIKNTFWLGRLQNITNSKLGKLLDDQSELWVDGAHNEAGAKSIADWINEINETNETTNEIDETNEINKTNKKETIAIFAILSRKNINAFIDNLKPSINKFLLIDKKTDEHNFEKITALKKELNKRNIEVIGTSKSIKNALKKIAKTHNGVRVIICGSLYFIGEALEELEG